MILYLPLSAAFISASAQDNASLSLPGEIRLDSLYGRIGDWFVLRSLDGESIPAVNFDHRVLFVNFWATWCGPCIEEMPTIDDLSASMDDSNIAFLLISIDENERDVRRYLKKHEIATPIYLRGWDPGESTFKGGMVPATFIVNKAGEIAYQHHGAANWNTESIRGLLSSLSRE